MAVYLLGSRGPEVSQIQQALSARFYSGSPDGVFGGGTESAVRAFQLFQNLRADGKVGPETWSKLFGVDVDDVPVPEMTTKPIDHQCLALTGAIETGHPPPDCFAGLSGDFDDQGISFGALQWNIGQGTLQPLLSQMKENHPDQLSDMFGSNYDALDAMLGESREEQLLWAQSIQDPIRHVLFEPWRGLFQTLGRTQEFQDIETQAAAGIFQAAMDLCSEYNVNSQRAAALMFDIKVQNGGIKGWVKSQIDSDFKQLDSNGMSDADREEAQLRIIATRVAAAANPKWVADVQNRKLTIANGEGIIHGCHYNLEDQYGITLNPAAA